jgi:DNA-binding transcriptional MerR regulator
MIIYFLNVISVEHMNLKLTNLYEPHFELRNNNYIRYKTNIVLPNIKEQNLTKLYYSIGEVADMFNVNTSLIRFWEKEFTALKPKKNNKGNRLFTPKEILKIHSIYVLVKENGYTLEGAKKALKSKVVDIPIVDQESEDLVVRLESIKEKLMRLKS